MSDVVFGAALGALTLVGVIAGVAMLRDAVREYQRRRPTE